MKFVAIELYMESPFGLRSSQTEICQKYITENVILTLLKNGNILIRQHHSLFMEINLIMEKDFYTKKFFE